MSTADAMTCPSCQSLLPAEAINTDYAIACPACEKTIAAWRFPRADYHEPPVMLGERITDDSEEAGGFYQPDRKAVAICDACGVFVSPLHAVAVGEQTICPRCIEREQNDPDSTHLLRERIRYDHLAILLSLGVLIMMWPLLIISAPIALYLVVRHYRRPGSIVQRSKTGFIIAGIISGLCVLLALTILGAILAAFDLLG